MTYVKRNLRDSSMSSLLTLVVRIALFRSSGQNHQWAALDKPFMILFRRYKGIFTDHYESVISKRPATSHLLMEVLTFPCLALKSEAESASCCGGLTAVAMRA